MVRPVAAAALLLSLISCGGMGGQSGNSVVPPQSPAAVPQAKVALVMLENAGYTDVAGSASMPFFNSLASQYALATNYFAVTHPSIGNYFMLTTGQIITNDDNYADVVSVDNLARELAGSGKTWKAYAESIPAAGYLGPAAAPYERNHVPFTYFSDVVDNASEAANIVPMTQLMTDLQNGNLPDFLFIVPSDVNNAHSCPPASPRCSLAQREAVADQWLSINIPPLLQNAQFQSNGILIILFDEAADTDTQNGGGQVACLIAGAKVKPGFRSATAYNHANALALIGSALRLPVIPGAGTNANNMSEFFQ